MRIKTQKTRISSRVHVQITMFTTNDIDIDVDEECHVRLFVFVFLLVLFSDVAFSVHVSIHVYTRIAPPTGKTGSLHNGHCAVAPAEIDSSSNLL